jgi:hypothetical protein
VAFTSTSSFGLAADFSCPAVSFLTLIVPSSALLGGELVRLTKTPVSSRMWLDTGIMQFQE